MVMLSVRPTESDVEQTVANYGNLLYKVSFLLVKNEADAADVVQDTFIKYVTAAPFFQSEEHKKAWLLRVAKNISKNYLRFSLMHNHMDIDSLYDLGCSDSENAVLRAVLALPEKYRLPIHLHYYEGYSVKEISELLRISPSAVLKRLQRGREKLKDLWEE